MKLDPLMKAQTVTRADVRVSRKYGWVVEKATDTICGCVWADENAIRETIWRAQAGDVSSFSFTRNGAIAEVIDLHNMQEKARAYDLLVRLVEREQ